MAQKIIDLDVVVPDDIKVRIDGEDYQLPGDIPIPDYLEISKAIEALESATGSDASELLEDLYERVMDLFRIHNSSLESLPIGPRRLGALVIQIYGNAAEEDAPPARPTRATGTRSSRPRPKARKSASSK